jgi:hypothetical protein
MARRDGDRVIVETETGEISLAASEVASIDAAHTSPVETYHEKLKAAKEPRELIELASWARERSMSRVVNGLLAKAAEQAGAKDVASLVESARVRGMEVDARPLLVRAARLAPEMHDANELAALARIARARGWSEPADAMAARVRALAGKMTDARDVLVLATSDPMLVSRALELCAGKTVQEILDLADRARTSGLDATRFYERAMAVDPKNEPARRALGYRLLNDTWVTNDEWQAANGNVKLDGVWMTPAERDFRIREKNARLDERVKELAEARAAANAERDAAERERRELARLVDSNRDLAARLDTQRRELEDEARRLKELREELEEYKRCHSCGGRWKGTHNCLGGYTQCGTCKHWYTGTHVCADVYSWCSCCGGYFKRGHSCRR